jgi:proteasome lid subunit RPN8/RPN11
MGARISRGALDAVLTHAREVAPAECCGLLLGAGFTIAAAARTRNIADTPQSRFVVDPADHIAARRAARAQGLDVVGFYHSHPRSPAVPSATDLAEAAYPEHLYLIVGLAADPPELQLFQFTDGPVRNFLPLPLVTVR